MRFKEFSDLQNLLADTVDYIYQTINEVEQDYDQLSKNGDISIISNFKEFIQELILLFDSIKQLEQGR